MNAPARVPLSEVGDLMAPGQPLPFSVLDGFGRLLLAQGQRLHDARQLKALLERGACVEVEEAQQARRQRAAGAGAGSPAPSTREPTWFDRFERQVWTLDELLRALVKGEVTGEVGAGSLAERLGAFADSFIAEVERHPDAALFLAVRQGGHRHALYSLTHGLNAATVALLAARQLGWPAPRARSVVLAALTMNVTITALQTRMAEQKEPPSKGQLDLIRAHPHAAAELLAAAGVANEDWLEAVRDHHERAGGGGYPRGDVAPGDAAGLLRAADVYAAKISPRTLRPALSPQLAARQLFQEQGGGPLAAALIKAVGVYPPGDLVTLKNGEVAVVVMRTAVGNAPQVAVLFSREGKPVPGTPRRDTTQGDTAIAAALADRSRVPRLLPEAVYGLLK
ncbi:MAG: phosphohydrolase [Rubrivivax sp.]|nr:phosphohydrolase [Rubrivivax sp.]